MLMEAFGKVTKVGVQIKTKNAITFSRQVKVVDNNFLTLTINFRKHLWLENYFYAIFL
mgnify:CR=1 FL=1